MKYQYMIVELGRYSTTLFITEDDWNEIVDSYIDVDLWVTLWDDGVLVN